MSCVVWSTLVSIDGKKMEGVLTVNIKNNDERRHSRRSSFGCHVTESDVAPAVAACWWVVVLGAGCARGWSLALWLAMVTTLVGGGDDDGWRW